MPEPIEPARLAEILRRACTFARVHGVDGRIEPSDFAVQRRAPGTHAVYVDADMAIVVVIDEHGRPTFGLADLSWVHFPDVEHGTQACTDECDGRRPFIDVHLPGDAPAEVVNVDA